MDRHLTFKGPFYPLNRLLQALSLKKGMMYALLILFLLIGGSGYGAEEVEYKGRYCDACINHVPMYEVQGYWLCDGCYDEYQKKVDGLHETFSIMINKPEHEAIKKALLAMKTEEPEPFVPVKRDE